MKLLAKQNRELIMVNAQNTQNENDAEKIILKVPEQYEDFNKKIVFVTPDGIVWDLIVNNEYLIKKAITKYKQVDFYIWLTKGDVDFRSQTKTLKFYQNVDASDEITDKEIGRVNTVVNLLEEEITKVENLESQVDGKLEEVDTAIENIHTAIQETENLDLDAEKVGQTTTITLTKKDGTVKTVHVDDGYDDTELKNDISAINTNIKANYYNKADTDTKLDTKANTTDISKIKEEITALQTENSRLKGITNALPKISGEDTSLTLTNTANAPLSDIILKGNTSQQQYSGKNLLNVISNVNDTNNGITFSIEKNGFQLKLNGTSQNSTGIAIGLNKIQLPQTGTYYFVAQIVSGSVTNNFGFGINFGKDNIIDLSNSTKSGKVSFSATKTEGYLTIFVNANISFNNLIINFQVISTDTLDLDFEPYVGGTASPNPDYPQDIKVVTGDNTITISNSDNTEKQELPISLGSLELCKIGDYQDYFYKSGSKWYLHKEINKITSYNGETITTSYISTTGELSTGAKVYYVVTPTDTKITDTTLISQLNELEKAVSYDDTTNISQTNANLPFIINAEAFKKIS